MKLDAFTSLSPIERALDAVEVARKNAEFAELVKLAEAVFPKDWNVRLEPFSDGTHVQVRFFITEAFDRDPTRALKKAIDWYQRQKGSRIVLP